MTHFVTLTRAALILIAVAGFRVPAQAQAPCSELLRLRNVANQMWEQAMRKPQSELCGALHPATLAKQATLTYANSNRETCDISITLRSQLEAYHREAVQARNNVCAGRPLRPFPADINPR